jgi:RNA polymerase sigma-70 factor (ECF subfamily)
MTQPSDEELYAAWARGDAQAGATLVARHTSPVHRLMTSMLMRTECNDAFQEVFKRFAEAARNAKSVAKVRAYLMGIARNVICETLRTRVKQTVDFAEDCVADICPDQSLYMAAREDERLLLKGLRRLPINDQILLELRYWEALKTREIAEILEQDDNAIRGKLHRALKALEALVQKLAESPEALQSTMGSITGWARSIREHVDDEEN